MRLLDRLGIDLEAVERFLHEHLKFVIISALSLLAFVIVVAVVGFFIFVKGAEQTLVPNVQGKELTTALLELQDKELYPRIQLRYSNSAAEKGSILEQEPKPGNIVKAGRRIKLVVSRGVIIDKIENYMGQDIDEVKMRLQAMFSSTNRPLLSIKEPLVFDFSSDLAGTIIQQSPPPGSEVSGPTQLSFVVSRGPESELARVPQLSGLRVWEAFEALDKAGVHWTLALRHALEGERGETVVSQLPAADQMVSIDTPIEILVSLPKSLRSGEVYGLFTHTVPEYPYPLALTLEALLPSGERNLVASLSHRGGEITLPYRVSADAVLILTVLDREIIRLPAEMYQEPLLEPSEDRENALSFE